MQRIMMKSKIHRATVTGADLNYIGSITLDPRLMELADIREHEQVHVLDIDNGARFETYVDPGGPGDVDPQRRRRPARAPRRQGHRDHLRAVRRSRAGALRADRRARRRAEPTHRAVASARSRRNSAPTCAEPCAVHATTRVRPPRARQRRRRPVRGGPRPARRAVGRPCSPRASSAGRPPATRRAASPPRSTRRRLARAARLRHARRGRRALRHRRGARARQRGPRRVRELMALGAQFDEVDPDGELARAREGGHSVARVVHAGGDATGAEIERALVAAVQRSRRRRPRGLARLRPPRGGRPRASASSRSTPDGARGRARAATWWSPPAARGSASRSPPTRRCRPATASRWRCGPASRSPTSSSCSSTRPHCTTRRCRARCSPRRCAARARSCATRQGVAFMADEHPLGRPRAARRGGPGDQPPPQRARPRPPVARRHGDRRLPGAVPHDLGGVPGRRPRSHPRLAAGRARRALPLRRRVHRSRRRRRRFPGCGRAARPRASGVHGANRLASNSLLEGLVFAARVGRGDRAGTRRARADRRAASASRRRRRRSLDADARRDRAARRSARSCSGS